MNKININLKPPSGDRNLKHWYNENTSNIFDANFVFADEIPLDVLHLHDAVFAEEETVENISLEYKENNFARNDPYGYWDKSYWWNQTDKEEEKRLHNETEERVKYYLAQTAPEMNMKYTEEEFQQILRDLDNENPVEYFDDYEYCQSITKRLRNHPPIAEDLLLLHDSVFIEGQKVTNNELPLGIQEVPPAKTNSYLIDLPFTETDDENL